MCVHWLTGDGLRREDGLRASVPARGGGFIATDRSVVCVRCCCVRSFLPENDRERSRCVWLSPRAPRPPSLTHRAEGGSLSRPRSSRGVIPHTTSGQTGPRVVYAAAAGCAHIHAPVRDWDCREDVGGSQRRRVLPPVHTDVAHARRQGHHDLFWLLREGYSDSSTRRE